MLRAADTSLVSSMELSLTVIRDNKLLHVGMVVSN